MFFRFCWVSHVGAAIGLLIRLGYIRIVLWMSARKAFTW